MPNENSFTLFKIGPMLVGFEEGKHSPDTYERCTQGHKWNVGFHFVGVELDFDSLGLTEGAEKYCFFCLRDMLRKHCGRVERG